MTRTFSFNSNDRNGSTYCFVVTIIGDDTIETNETFRIALASSTGDTVDPSEVTITLIHDGDGEYIYHQCSLPNYIAFSLSLAEIKVMDLAA